MAPYPFPDYVPQVDLGKRQRECLVALGGGVAKRPGSQTTCSPSVAVAQLTSEWLNPNLVGKLLPVEVADLELVIADDVSVREFVANSRSLGKPGVDRDGNGHRLRASLIGGLAATLVAGAVAAAVFVGSVGAVAPMYRVSRVIDGDTIELRNGQHVRLVQIDTPEVYGGVECYGRSASAVAERLLPAGTRVRLVLEPTSDPVDRYGRLLRYVVRASDGMNVNLRLVTVGAAAPWFYEGERGRYFAKLQALAKRARAKRLGFWGACPRTPYDPYNAVATRR
jgi:endonuclease YncB( thermonuclease family)